MVVVDDFAEDVVVDAVVGDAVVGDAVVGDAVVVVVVVKVGWTRDNWGNHRVQLWERAAAADLLRKLMEEKKERKFEICEFISFLSKTFILPPYYT